MKRKCTFNFAYALKFYISYEAKDVCRSPRRFITRTTLLFNFSSNSSTQFQCLRLFTIIYFLPIKLIWSAKSLLLFLNKLEFSVKFMSKLSRHNLVQPKKKSFLCDPLKDFHFVLLTISLKVR